MIVGPLFFSLLTLLAVLVGSPVVSAQDSPGRFFNPADSGPASDFSEDAIWRVGETQTIKFTTTYSSYTIDLWQQDTQGGSASQGPSIFQVSSGAVTQFDWSVQTFQFDLATSEVFFLWLTPVDQDGTDSVTSHYFNITASAATSSSSISSSTSFSSTATTSTTTTSAAASSIQTSAPPSPSPTRKATPLSTGAQAGIGVGVGLVGLVAIVAGALLWRRRKNSSRGTPQIVAGRDDYDQPEMARGPHGEGYQKSPPPSYPIELDANGGLAETPYHTMREPIELR
ncbi:hypothetical protein F4820DRAFT_446626 [Hypoxylon rubiginosum]|uniref:Uncharacterized protein n=1 Tax=Hypoxylon rubiginosum TaxID=110542 RepID=A0ACB9Z7F6_9PEZI|nr:hypothetical protein F4820DRAFT_446626 [Hypoxylon rubiginosum]